MSELMNQQLKQLSNKLDGFVTNSQTKQASKKEPEERFLAEVPASQYWAIKEYCLKRRITLKKWLIEAIDRDISA